MRDTVLPCLGFTVLRHSPAGASAVQVLANQRIDIAEEGLGPGQLLRVQGDWHVLADDSPLTLAHPLTLFLTQPLRRDIAPGTVLYRPHQHWIRPLAIPADQSLR